MAWLAVAAAVVSIAGSMQAGKAAKRAGLQQQAAMEYQAQQDEINGKQAMAVAERDAAEQRRQGDLMQSRAIALMAASGGGATDIGNVTILARNAGETAYRSAVAIYNGEEQVRTHAEEATAARLSGQAAAQSGRDAEKAYMFKAVSSGLSGGSSLFSQYGGTQPPAPVYDRTPTPTGRG